MTRDTADVRDREHPPGGQSALKPPRDFLLTAFFLGVFRQLLREFGLSTDVFYGFFQSLGWFSVIEHPLNIQMLFVFCQGE